MKYKVKKLLAIMLTLSLIITTVLSVPQITASAETEGYYTYLVYDGQATITDCSTSISGKVTIPSTLGGYPVTSIGYGAFYGCDGLTSVTIPNSVKDIDDCAFYGCTGLTSVTIPNSVTSIGGRAFYGCSGLTSVTIGNSVTSIGSWAFEGCTGLESITVDKNNPTYHSAGNCLIETASKILIYGCKNSIIPSDGSVTSIDNWAFYECTGLTSIAIPDSVTSIGEDAFRGCTGLTSVTIGNSVTSIDYWAFYECTGLESITVDKNNPTYHSAGNCIIETTSKKLIYGCKNSIIPSDGSVTSIDYWAFYGCSGLTSVTIPNSVTSIGGYAFYNTAYYNEPVNWNDGVLYIEDCLIAAHYTVSGNYTIKNGTRLIADDAFYACTGLTSVSIPNSVTSIGSWAFSGCTGLTSVTIPNSVTSIDHDAFSDCAGLTSITIPNSVTSIGWDAFYGCDNLKTVYYFGTPEEFATLVTENDNDWLLDLDIVYMQQLESNDVELTAERGVLEEGTVLTAEKIDSNLEQIAEQLPQDYNAKSIVVYELNLTKDGEKVEFDGTVTVSVPLPEGISPNKCRVLYMADDSSLTDMNAVYKDGAMVFDTTHFSTYILVKDNKVTPGDLDGNEEITDADAVYLLMNTFFPEDYPLNQPGDFDGDGQVTDADAVYLLMYTFFPEDYPIA